jgi:RNA polymerase sigma-70 factor (ECF subfamily)
MAGLKANFDVGADLYRGFCAGDEAAFEELVALYRDNLTSYINGFVCDKHEAEELAVDAFAELAIGRNYKGRSSLKTYLFAIGRHLAAHHVKWYRNIETIPLDGIISEIIRSGSGSESENPLEADFLREEQKEQLHAAMRALKPDYREVLYLVYFENMSYKDAGNIMRKTEKQITNLTHRAKASLKKLLESEEARDGDAR